MQKDIFDYTKNIFIKTTVCKYWSFGKLTISRIELACLCIQDTVVKNTNKNINNNSNIYCK